MRRIREVHSGRAQKHRQSIACFSHDVRNAVAVQIGDGDRCLKRTVPVILVGPVAIGDRLHGLSVEASVAVAVEDEQLRPSHDVAIRSDSLPADLVNVGFAVDLAEDTPPGDSHAAGSFLELSRPVTQQDDSVGKEKIDVTVVVDIHGLIQIVAHVTQSRVLLGDQAEGAVAVAQQGEAALAERVDDHDIRHAVSIEIGGRA